MKDLGEVNIVFFLFVVGKFCCFDMRYTGERQTVKEREREIVENQQS